MARGPMQLNRLHRLKAGPACIQPDTFETTFFRFKSLNQFANLVLVSIVHMLFELEWF